MISARPSASCDGDARHRHHLPGCGGALHLLGYANRLPLYRQSEIYARDGIELKRSTLAGWVRQSAALLRPLIDAVERHVMSGARLHADDTPLPVLAPGAIRTKTGRLWAYLRHGRPFAG